MEIGILSMQKVINYGSFLQAYALQQIIKSMGDGIEVSFIDIIPGKPAEHAIWENGGTKLVSAKINEKQSKKSQGGLFKILIRKQHSVKFILVMKRYQKKYLCSEKTEGKNYDLAVIGSDEVFNGIQNVPWGLSLQLYGEHINAERIISYAASCGYTTLEYLTEREKKQIKGAMEHISSFSVRDGNTRAFVYGLTGKEALFHLDPVLIYDFKREVSKSRLRWKKRYLLVYSYGNRIKSEEEIKAIRKYAKKKNLEIISAQGFQFWCDRHVVVTPFELLSLFQNAACIVTDTFHGTVISAKYNKRFVAIVRESNYNKLADLAGRINIQERILKKIECLDELMDTPFDFSETNRIIERERMRTFEYLRENIRLAGDKNE